VIDFNDIGVLKEQFTPATFPLLFLQGYSLDAIAQGMRFELLAPGEKVAIVRAGRSLDFDVSLDMCLCFHALLLVLLLAPLKAVPFCIA
jgi:hypothetical protein